MSTDEPQRTLFELIEAPALRDPVLILALEGWIDAAGATRAARQLLVEVGAGRRLARFDTDRLLDHRARRPTLRLVDGVASGLVWPSLELSLLEGIDGAELLLLHGPEPDHEWKAFAAAVGSLGRRLGISMVIGLGAYPAAVPHTRPTRLSCTAGSSEMATRLEVVTASAEVPAGAQAVVEAETAAAGIPTIGLWAQVPHYLAAGPYPPATLALLAGVTELTSAILDTGPIPGQALAARSRIDELVGRNPEHVAMIEKLESAYDDLHEPGAQLPSGEDLAAELEAFLRTQDGA